MKTDISLADLPFLDLKELSGSFLLVTGGTGLVGFNLLKELSKVSKALDLKLIALVRDKARAEEKFRDFLDCVTLITGDVTEPLKTDLKIDYIIHAASVTSSKTFVDNPVDTIFTSIAGTYHLLSLAVEKKVKSFVYLSSMEAYGTVLEERLLSEADLGYIDPLKVRSCYSEGKRMCENLCVSFLAQYGVPVKMARLAQVFGPGIPKGDNRLFMQFMKTAMGGKSIEIKASGNTSRMYIYTFDAVTAVLSILLNGENGQAYNTANRETYKSVYELAVMMSEMFGGGKEVLRNTGTPQEIAVYPPDSFLRLDTSALESLGWKPCYSLSEGLMALSEEFKK